MKNVYDVAVIGAGLSGLIAAYELKMSGRQVCIIDPNLTTSSFGGLAEEFGNKLSLPPAGMGLSKVSGGSERLIQIALELIGFFGYSGKIPKNWLTDLDLTDQQLADGIKLRRYHAIMLTGAEMRTLIGKISPFTNGITAIRSSCRSVSGSTGNFEISLCDGDGRPDNVYSKSVVVAAGRSAYNIKLPVAPETTLTKGIDVGLRLEFEDYSSFQPLLNLSHDAKVLKGSVRTFCLNAPGKIERYTVYGIPVAGGAIAKEGCKGNFGILVRTRNKTETMERIKEAVKELPPGVFKGPLTPNEMKEAVLALYGEDVYGSIDDFIRSLESNSLIDRKGLIGFQLPLLDWFWPTYCQPDTLSTSMPDFWVTGDLAGHARGLLQALISGFIVSKKIIGASLEQ